MDDMAPPSDFPVEVGDTHEPRVPYRLFALKSGDTFVVADAFGDIQGVADGLFRNDTRLLSRFRVSLGGRPPSLLSSAMSQDNVFFTSNTTNRPLPPTGGAATPRGVIHVERKRFLWEERLFDEWIEKSRADLSLLVTDLPTGPYPYAGIPWFSTAFGRDAIITAWQVLWLNATLARGVLTYLAANQAYEVSKFRDSQPGKIMHETRKGEMTTLGELPFGKYYGGVDTTPLFVALAGAYYERTGDMAFIDQLWPALERAVAWLDEFGDSDGDGLIDYQRGADTGLANQGWKDSQDSVFHANGDFPDGPIALVEVQGYAYAAYSKMALMADKRGDESAGRWRARAKQIRDLVEKRFWMEDQGFYGIAIDGKGELCRVRSSNPGHLLFCGLPSPERARRVTEHLLSGPFASGWGVRTLAVGEARYNPMSYHNGSIWPHDTALCVAGMARYGERDGVVRLLSEIFETAVRFEMRLPELFCGFARAPGEPPVAYPVACVPQAWAAGSIFMLLQACLGISINGVKGEITIEHPALPIGIDSLKVDNIRIGDRTANLLFQHAGDRVIAVTGKRSDPTIPVITRS